MNKERLIVFIIGAGHSGSTLLSKTLNAHSKIFSVSEISQFQQDINSEIALCGCETLLKECDFWEDISNRVEIILGDSLKEKPYLYGINKNISGNKLYNKLYFRFSRFVALNLRIRTKLIKTRLEYISVLYKAIIDKTGADAIVDSSKSATRASILKPYLERKGYRVKIIHLIRDGRAVFYSYKKGFYKVRVKNRTTGVDEMKTYYAENVRSDEEIVNLWKRDNRLSLLYHNLFSSSNYYQLTYEEFVDNPKVALISLLQSINYKFESEMLKLNRYTNHMVSGNASRINATSINQPSEIWRNKLSKDQLNYFEKKAGRLNRKFGYK